MKDKKNVSELSKQRRWQLKKLSQGKCQLCGQPSQGKSCCNVCAKRRYGTKKRRPLKIEWAAVDWSKTPTTIAQEMGVHVSSVSLQKRKYSLNKD